MAGALTVVRVNGTDGGGGPAEAVFLMTYDDQLRATGFSGSNATAQTVAYKVVGLTGGVADPDNKTFGLILPPSGTDAVAIPVNGARAFALGVNAHGALSGFEASSA